MKQPSLKIGVDLLIPIVEILYLKSKGNYTEVITLKGKMVSSSTLKVLRSRLENQPFILVRRGLLVHNLYIDTVENHIIPPILILKTGESFSISRRAFTQLKLDLKKFSKY